MRRKSIRPNVRSIEEVRQALLDLDMNQPEWWVTDIQTANFTAQPGQFVRCNPSGGAFSVTLPPAVSTNKGREITVKNVTASNTAITVFPTGTDTIDGAASEVIAVGLAKETFVSNGDGEWMILSST